MRLEESVIEHKVASTTILCHGIELGMWFFHGNGIDSYFCIQMYF